MRRGLIPQALQVYQMSQALVVTAHSPLQVRLAGQAFGLPFACPTVLRVTKHVRPRYAIQLKPQYVQHGGGRQGHRIDAVVSGRPAEISTRQSDFSPTHEVLQEACDGPGALFKDPNLSAFGNRPRIDGLG